MPPRGNITGRPAAVTTGNAPVEENVLEQFGGELEGLQSACGARILVARTRDEIRLHLAELTEGGQRPYVLGFDCEWPPHDKKSRAAAQEQHASRGHGKNGCATLQLATRDVCVVVQLLHALGARTPPDDPPAPAPQELAELLASDDVLKVGVGVDEDARRLAAAWDLRCGGLVDLRVLAEREGMQGRSLSDLAAEAGAGALDKTWALRCSDWASRALSRAQLRYAAGDALAAARILHAMRAAGGGVGRAGAREFCAGAVDVRFSGRRVVRPRAPASAGAGGRAPSRGAAGSGGRPLQGTIGAIPGDRPLQGT
jgi:hypothetical protein